MAAGHTKKEQRLVTMKVAVLVLPAPVVSAKNAKKRFYKEGVGRPGASHHWTWVQ
jgi:hypothetical protein